MMGDDDVAVADAHLHWIPPGEYEVMYVSHETRFIHGRKLIITFRITDREMADVRVMSYYNVMSFLSDPGVGGRFKVGRCSKFFREFTRLFEPDTPRLDRLPMSRFRHQPILARIRGVRAVGGLILSEAAKYSVVDQLISVIRE